MPKLNKNTKKAQGFIDAFLRAKEQGNTSIYAVYARPSPTKISIAEEIEYQARKDNATIYYMGGNSFNFTCGYAREAENKAELIIFTKSYTYKIAL